MHLLIQHELEAESYVTSQQNKPLFSRWSKMKKDDYWRISFVMITVNKMMTVMILMNRVYYFSLDNSQLIIKKRGNLTKIFLLYPVRCMFVFLHAILKFSESCNHFTIIFIFFMLWLLTFSKSISFLVTDFL